VRLCGAEAKIQGGGRGRAIRAAPSAPIRILRSMDVPHLPPAVAEELMSRGVIAGKSALPAFLAVEAWARERTAAAETEAAARLQEAQGEAERVRSEGERALREAVLEGEREALRDVETRSRDRVSQARRALEAWIQAGEQTAQESVPDALALLCGDAGGGGD